MIAAQDRRSVSRNMVGRKVPTSGRMLNQQILSKVAREWQAEISQVSLTIINPKGE
jgi:hypothetical protein